MNVPIDIIGLVTASLSFIGIGIAIGVLRSYYLTKAEHEKLCEACQKANDKKFDEMYENRRDVWDKVNKTYDRTNSIAESVARIEGYLKGKI